jgi:hypothetical protein
MKPFTFDCSLIVFAHDQRHALHATVVSVGRAAARALANGRQLERLLVVGPDPSAETTAYIEGQLDDDAWVVLRLADSGVGTQRRQAVAASTGRLVAMLDAPDLWSEHFIAAALDVDASTREPVVWRPEVVLSSGVHYYFDHEACDLLWQPDSTGSYDPGSLLMEHPYASTFAVRREVLHAVPFPDADASRGWVDVDWWWSCNVAGSGVAHRTVPGTCCYQRSIPGRTMPMAGRAQGRSGPSPLLRGGTSTPKPAVAGPAVR